MNNTIVISIIAINYFICLGVNMCCLTPPISSLDCIAGPVINTNYVNQIHASCPTAYSYAYDDEGGLHNCPGETSFDVVICP